MSIEEFTEHRHPPPHLFRPQSFYFVTGATLKKQPFLMSNAKKENLLTTLHERSYLARLHYVHVNPVKHGYVNRPQDYQFCSYAWFVNSLDPEFNERVFNQPIDEIRVRDDFWNEKDHIGNQ